MLCADHLFMRPQPFEVRGRICLGLTVLPPDSRAQLNAAVQRGRISLRGFNPIPQPRLATAFAANLRLSRCGSHPFGSDRWGKYSLEPIRKAQDCTKAARGRQGAKSPPAQSLRPHSAADDASAYPRRTPRKTQAGRQAARGTTAGARAGWMKPLILTSKPAPSR
jgi:hypothetical protein